jgi:SAM-dependent MidA family methyltransferase
MRHFITHPSLKRVAGNTLVLKVLSDLSKRGKRGKVEIVEVGKRKSDCQCLMSI